MGRTHKALVVDDVESNALLLEIMLNNLGITDVSTAYDGSRALDMFGEALTGKAPYSLILLDFVMPLMEGQDVVMHMRAKEEQMGIGAYNNKAIIIMVTSLDSSADIMYTMSHCDCDDYIVKPVTPDMLRSVLTSHGVIS